jgi:hypothetical protein
MVLMATKRMLGSDWLTVMSLGQLGSSVNDRHVLNRWNDTGTVARNDSQDRLDQRI